MNYYERVQAAIDYIESNLSANISIEILCSKSIMSRANLYRMFFTLTGYTIKEYVRLRRLSEASRLMQHENILDAALAFGFNNHESFSRAFKQVTQVPPKIYKKNELILEFERIDIMDKYFDVQEPKLIEKYPEIKVLKELKPFKVAYYRFFGHNPEDGAFKEITRWAKEHVIDMNKTRIFGFNNPSPMKDGEPYGYEIWVTIPDDSQVKDALIKEKIVDGGLYAVTTVKNGPKNIYPAWQRLNAWLLDSKYTTGQHQWLEEHHGFNDYEHTGDIDLFMPIQKAKDIQVTYCHQEDLNIISLRERQSPTKVFDKLYRYAKSNHLIHEQTRFFAFYDPELIGKKEFWYEACMTLNSNHKTSPPFEEKQFKGGFYAIRETEYSYNGNCWAEFIHWVKSHPKYDFGEGYWFFEEYILNDQPLAMSTKVKQFMPVKRK